MFPAGEVGCEWLGMQTAHSFPARHPGRATLKSVLCHQSHLDGVTAVFYPDMIP